MIKASQFVGSLHQRGYSQFIGVPCSYLSPFINYVIDDEDSDYIGAASEGEAIGIGMGSYLGGRKTVVMCQNSGLGNMVNPLTSLCHPFQIPLLLIVTWRGQPGLTDEPQHELMGRITTQLLETMEIPWSLFPAETGQIETVLSTAEEYMTQSNRPFALIMQKGTVENYSLKDNTSIRRDFALRDATSSAPDANVSTKSTCGSRTDVLRLILKHAPSDAIVIATTGKTGRELYTLRDDERQLYVVGGMGTASSIGLGLAHACPNRPIVVIDGDGSMLMKMGSLATIGCYQPKNLFHFVLDNEHHDSTGGQQTASPTVRFDSVARGTSYPVTEFASDRTTFESSLARCFDSQGPCLLHAKIDPGSPADLGRPKIRPHEVKSRLMQFLSRNPAQQRKQPSLEPNVSGD